MTAKTTTKTGNNGLFPDTWVVGEAAAELAKNDEGVLLASGIRPGQQPDSAGAAINLPQSVSPGGDARMPDPEARQAGSREQEIAELHAENERLRRRIKLTRRYPVTDAQMAAPGRVNPNGDLFADDAFPGVRIAGSQERPRRRWAIVVLGLLICIGLLVVSLPVERLESLRAALPQSLQTWTDEMQTRVAEADYAAMAASLQTSGQQLAAELSAYLQETWQTLTAEPQDGAGASSR
jgi:hypothetical protein